MLLCVPYKHSEFVRAMFRLDYRWSKSPPQDKQLTLIQLARIKEVVLHMPHIMHALVDGLKAAHMAGIIHTDLHPFNIVLDFIQMQKPRIGIIDWGLMLRKECC